MKTRKTTQILGLVLYLLGAALAFTMLALSVWGDIEASTFSAALSAEEPLRSLNCPVLITRDETGIISATIDNPTDREVSPNVRARITMGFVTLYNEENTTVPIPPYSSQRVAWEVTAENAAFGQLILARIYQFQNFAVPSRQAGCGIVVLPFTGPPGQQIFYGSLVLSAVIMTAGLGLYRGRLLEGSPRNSAQNNRLRRIIRAFIFLGAYLLGATLLSIIGDTLLSIGLMVFAVVSVIVVFSFATISN